MNLLRVVLMVVAGVSVANNPIFCWALTYDEGVDGDLSDAGGSPTVIGTLDVGSNLLAATSGDEDYDHVGFSIAAGTQLDSIVLTTYDDNSQSFTGLHGGTTWTTGVGGAVNPAVLLGWTHFGPDAAGADIGDNLLDNMSVAPAAIGFATPLGSGDYNMLLQDTGAPVSYSMTFNVSIIPEPATLYLLAIAGLISFVPQRRRLSC